ncbi:MAG: hypothetical protein OXC31_13275 [Spirochaetaceae bacterium]|nr:hypothetical protein [Spirochaetaceae bacterium]
MVLTMPADGAHPFLVLVFLAAMWAAGLAGMLLLRHRRDRPIRRPRTRPATPNDDDSLPMAH